MRLKKRDKPIEQQHIKKGILPMWFWPVMDKVIWPVLGLLIGSGLYVLAAHLTGM